MGEFYHVYVSPKTNIKREDIENKLNAAIDWFRYDSKCWVIYTTSNVEKWLSRLQPLVEPNGTLFICKLDVSKLQGWMTEEFWEWLGKRVKEDGK